MPNSDFKIRYSKVEIDQAIAAEWVSRSLYDLFTTYEMLPGFLNKEKTPEMIRNKILNASTSDMRDIWFLPVKLPEKKVREFYARAADFQVEPADLYVGAHDFGIELLEFFWKSSGNPYMDGSIHPTRLIAALPDALWASVYCCIPAVKDIAKSLRERLPRLSESDPQLTAMIAQETFAYSKNEAIPLEMAVDVIAGFHSDKYGA